jgi:hypothetical protein
LSKSLTFSVKAEYAGINHKHLVAKPGESQPITSADTCMALYANKGDLRGNLAWKAGEYIRVYKWDNGYKNSGIGFNLATKEIGLFHVAVNYFKVVD